MTPTPIQSAIAAIKSAPRINGGRIFWKANPAIMAEVAAAIIGASDQLSAMKAITEATHVQEWTMRHFIRGNDASGVKCQRIHDGLAARGLSVVSYDRRTAAGRSVAADKTKAPAPTPKPIVLATTNKGEVIVADPPAQISAPQVMAAKPGEFATKENGTRCVLDTKTKDILIITTRRIEFGTPAWCEKMVEINSKPKA